jgi:hypothetical protein
MVDLPSGKMKSVKEQWIDVDLMTGDYSTKNIRRFR